jgi:hypothetical protein
MMAQGQSEKLRVGEDLARSRLQDLLSTRQSFFGGEGAQAETTASQGQVRGQYLSELLRNNASSQNAFNQQNYQTFQDAYGRGYGQNLTQRQAQATGRMGLIQGGLQLAGTAAGAYFGQPQVGAAISSAAGRMFGGGGQQPTSVSSSYLNQANRFAPFGGLYGNQPGGVMLNPDQTRVSWGGGGY